MCDFISRCCSRCYRRHAAASLLGPEDRAAPSTQQLAVDAAGSRGLFRDGELHMHIAVIGYKGVGKRSVMKHLLPTASDQQEGRLQSLCPKFFTEFMYDEY
eukprot:TRINITY_DN35675_c0_g2_i1.p1 TRINITY_DN35675_c0_g2~~TRINITY_DN35675_c0_g2_i1.p1  ORF type:complete len:101 (-),score=18.89 TRINITY_DN35675_c0_g2_i1:209-511(-)